MPYGKSKRNYKSKTSRKKSKYSSKKYPTTKALSKRVDHIVKEMAPELKYVDEPVNGGFTAATSPAPNGGEYVVCMNYGILASTTIPTDAQGMYRLSQRIRMTSLHIDVMVTGNITMYDVTQHFRMIVFYDDKSNGFQYNSTSSAAPVAGYLSGLVEAPSSGSGAVPEPVLDNYGVAYNFVPANNQSVQQYNHYTTRLQPRYKILYDKVYQGTVYGSQTNWIKHVNTRIKLGRTCTYGAAGYSTYPENNALYVVFCADDKPDGDTGYSVYGTIRLYYKDVT